MTDTPETFLTLREAVMEIRGDVKDLAIKLNSIDVDAIRHTQDDHETRIRGLEGSGLRLKGAWATLCLIGGSGLGVAGLVLGALSYFTG